MGLLSQIFGGPDQSQALGLLGMSMMQGNAPQGFGLAMQHMAGAKERQMKQSLLDMQMQEIQANLEDRRAKTARERAAEERAELLRKEIPSLYRQPGFTGGQAQPQMEGGVPMFSKPMSVSPMQATPGGFDVQRALSLGLDPKAITDYAGLQNLGRPEVARVEETMRDGRPVKLQFDKFGNPVGDALAQWKAPVSVNQGDRTTFVDPVSLQPKQAFGINMSPAERDASGRGWATFNETKRHNQVTESGAVAGRAPQGYRYKQDGSLEAIPGGPADKQSAATADERKAATLLQRLEGSQRQLTEALSEAPSAAKPEIIPSTIRSFGMPDAANVITSGKRQEVEAAQLDMLDAALTLGTGAAYTREQLEGYRRSYFPQIGDSPGTVKEKQARLANVIQAAKIAAGRAANVTTGAAGQQDRDPLKIR